MLKAYQSCTKVVYFYFLFVSQLLLNCLSIVLSIHIKFSAVCQTDSQVTGKRYPIIIFMPGHGGHTIEILLASTARATQLPHLPILCTLGNTSFSTLSRVQKEKRLSSVVNSSLI